MPVHDRPLEPNSTADGSFRASADHCRQLGCVPGDGGHVEEASFLTVFLQVCQYTQPLLVRSCKFSTEYQAGYGRSSDAKRLEMRREPRAPQTASFAPSTRRPYSAAWRRSDSGTRAWAGGFNHAYSVSKSVSPPSESSHSETVPGARLRR